MPVYYQDNCCCPFIKFHYCFNIYTVGSVGQSLIGAFPVGFPSLSTGVTYSAMKASKSAAAVIDCSMVLDAPLKMVLSRKDRQAMEISLQWLDPVSAPIRAGEQIGTLVLSLPGEVTKLPLRAARDVETLGLFTRIGAAVKYLIFGALHQY